MAFELAIFPQFLIYFFRNTIACDIVDGFFLLYSFISGKFAMLTMQNVHIFFPTMNEYIQMLQNIYCSHQHFNVLNNQTESRTME